MKQFLNILKIFGATAGAIATLWGVFSLVDTIKDNQVIDQVNHETMMTEIGSINICLDSLYVMDERRDEKDGEIINEVMKNRAQFFYYIQHQEEMTKEQILDAFEFGVNQGKKKELTLLETGTP